MPPPETNSKGVASTILERLDFIKLPEVLLSYIRMLFSLLITLVLGYIILKSLFSLSNDLNEQYESEMIKYADQKERCADEY